MNHFKKVCEFVYEIYSRARQRVKSSMTNELHQALQIDALKECFCAFFSSLLDLGLIVADGSKDTVTDDA